MRRKILFLLLAISAGIMFLDSRGLVNPLRILGQKITVPLQYTVYFGQKSLTDNFRVLTFWKSGEERIKNLEQRNAELWGRAATADNLLRENSALKKQLEVRDFPDFRFIPGEVLADNDMLEIDRGIADGIKTGQAAVYGNLLVGVVYRVTGNTSYILRPFDSRSKIAVKIGAVRGEVVGQFNNSMLLTKVAQNENINPGDLVLTSGEGGVLLPDLLVGKISEIHGRESDIFKTATVDRVFPETLADYIFIAVPINEN